ncbi:MAG: hypothetical protein KatS3mg084_0494 [Candidatus Dojkabacteria bacterium]|nr:MAG: hypothetical protein KatS3mg084_0494 [Candidatus Dojkabacteria bacterium]
MHFGGSGSGNPDGNAQKTLAEARMEAIERLGRRDKTYWIVNPKAMKESNPYLSIGDKVDEEVINSCVFPETDYIPGIDDPARHIVISTGGEYPFATMRISEDPNKSILAGFVVEDNGRIEYTSLLPYMKQTDNRVYVDRVLTFSGRNPRLPKEVARALLLIAFGCGVIHEASKKHPFVPKSVGVSGYSLVKALQAVLGPHLVKRYKINTCGVRMEKKDETTGTLVSDSAWIAEASNAGIAHTLSLIFRNSGDKELAAMYRELARGLAESDLAPGMRNTFLKSVILHDRFLGFYLWLKSFSTNLFTTIQTIPQPGSTKVHTRAKLLQALSNIIRIPVTQMVRWGAIRKLAKGLQDFKTLTGSPVAIAFNSNLTNMNELIET